MTGPGRRSLGEGGRASDPLTLRLCLLVVRLASRIVPAEERGPWRLEWEAELRHRWTPAVRISRAGEITMVRRSFGSLVDAAWFRRQLTLDADVVHDAAYGVRLLAKAPAFTAVALIVLAIGIGASTAIVSLTDALLFRRLPIPDADRVVTLWERNLATGVAREDVAPGNAIDWVTKPTSFSAATVEPWSLDFTAPGGEPEVLQSVRVSQKFFDVLGVPMLHGRPFLPAEFTKGHDNVVVLAYGVWQERFNGDPSVVGRAIQLDHLPYTVVGVMRAGINLRLFEARREPRLYIPKYFEDYEPRIRGTGYWNVVGRLKPETSIAQARQELEVLSAQLARELPNSNKNTVAEVIPIRDHLAGSVRNLLPLLLAAAGLLLLVACANVANLLLARGASRGREFAMRQALGAGRGRLVRQMLAESLLLATAGGMLGLLVAKWGLQVIASLSPLDVAGIDRLALDARVAAIAFGLSLLAAAVAGVAPALQLSRPNAALALRQGATSPAARRVRSLLVVVEVCLALLLAVGAGLLVRSLRAIEHVDPGFAKAQVFALQIFAWDRNVTPQKRAAFFEQTLEKMRAQPGVIAAGAVSAMPFIEANINIRSSMTIDGRPPSAPGDDTLIFTTIVAGNYFRAMSIPLERGRLLDSSDRAEAQPVAVISRSAARKFWPGADPVGAKVRIRFEGKLREVTVVGVVGDARHDALDRPARAELFLPHAQAPFGSMTYVVQAAPGSTTTMQMLKAQVWSIDPLQAFYRTATLDELVSRTLVGRRFTVFLLTGFGLAALVLAAAGLYGVMSFSTSQRAREFGVRVALGAQRRDILSMVVGEGLRLALAGIAAGVIAAVWFTRFLKGLLFGTSAADPVTFLAVSGGILVISALSCYIPARRAVSVDPLISLKQ
jgi:putative ABC transport system permease protein